MAQADTTLTSDATATTAVSAAAPPPSLLYREADLMAFPATTAERGAVARAEWVLTCGTV